MTVAAAACIGLPFVAVIAPEAQDRSGTWEVTCGIPMSDPALDSLDHETSTILFNPVFDREHQLGHRKSRNVVQQHPESDVAVEMWILSEGVGWWLMMSLRIHPDEGQLAEPSDSFRTILESPLLKSPVVVRNDDDETRNTVMDHISAVMPHALDLRCAP